MKLNFTWSRTALLLFVLLPLSGVPVGLRLGASEKSAASKKPIEPWQRTPFNARDEADEDSFRQNVIKMMNSLVQASYRRYLAEGSLQPEFAMSDPNAPISTSDALKGSTLLDLHEQGVIWLSLLLSSHDSSVQQFQAAVLDGLEDDPALNIKQVRKRVKKYDIDKQAKKKQATDLIVETENEFGALVKDLNSTIPKNTDSRDYYERVLATYKGYLEGQLPKVLDLARAGEPTTFFILSPRFGNSTPLEKDIHYKRTADEAKKKSVTPRDVRYQGIYVVRVTPLDRLGERYHLVGFWLYLRINDPEIYVQRDPVRALTGTGGWDLHHMPPLELSTQGLVSPPKEWMEIRVAHGKLAIVKGQSAFLQRRAEDVDLSNTSIDRLQPAAGDIDPTPPRFSLSAKDYARAGNEFSKAAVPQRGNQSTKALVDKMPDLPARYQFPDTPEGEQAYQDALAHAIAPYSGSPQGETASSTNAPGAITPSQSAMSTASPRAEVATARIVPIPPQAVSPEEVIDPQQVRVDFGKLPSDAEAWLHASYTPPSPMQQERLRLALYWIAQFLSDAKNRNPKPEAMKLLLSRLPGTIYCVNDQSIHTMFPVKGNVVIAGMKNSFDAPLPELANELLAALESMVYQFGRGQPKAQEYRSEIRQAYEQFFLSQSLNAGNPDPFLLAARTAPARSDEWRLVGSTHVWDYPNPYRFFETKKSDDDADDEPPAKLDPDTISRLKLEKATVSELGLDGVFNKDKQGNSRNDQGALLPLGMLFQLTVKEPAGLLLLGRAEENERILSLNAVHSGDEARAAAHLRKANEIAKMSATVKTLRQAVPNAYLDLYLIKAVPERTGSKAASVPANSGSSVAGPAWRSRWIQYKDRWTLVAGVRQSDIPINAKLIEKLADGMNEKLPAGESILPALQVLKESIQNSTDPQYGSYASMLAEMDRIEAAPAIEGTGTTKP